jgi:tetratricopeptide (TPR) repeat protein
VVFGQVRGNYPGTRQADYAQVETAVCREQRGEFDEALAEMKDYLSRAHEDPVYLAWAHYLRGALALRESDFGTAEGEFRAVLAIPQNGLVRTATAMGLARCLTVKGEVEGALEALLGSAEAAPKADEKAVLLYNAMICAKLMGNAELAGSLLERMQAECPDSYITGRAPALLSATSE